MMMMMNNNSENNINSIMDNADEQSWQDADRESIAIDRESIAEHRNIFTDICQSSSIFILLVLIAVIPCKFIVCKNFSCSFHCSFTSICWLALFFCLSNQSTNFTLSNRSWYCWSSSCSTHFCYTNYDSNICKKNVR